MPVPQTKVLLNSTILSGGGITFSAAAAGDLAPVLTGIPSPTWISGITDLNGDGLADFIIGVPGDDDKAANAGRVFVSLGSLTPGSTHVLGADAATSIMIDGWAAGDLAGATVGSVADLNGDGLAEILVGAPAMDKGAALDAGVGFVLWGKAVAGGIDLGDPNTGGGSGYAIKGEAAGDAAATTILSVGDMNGDGKADLLVGAAGNDAGGVNAGAAYVVWGKGTNSIVQLTSVAAGTGGFKIIGEGGGDAVGSVLAVLGDQNGDGRSEILIGVADDNTGGTNAGAVYVVDGKATGTAVNLANVAAGTGGYKIIGVAQDDAGAAVSSAGDVNGDGRADILIGAPRSDSAYVVFGKADHLGVNLATVAAGTGGFKIRAETAGDLDTMSVTGGVDLNRDGIADYVIGASANGEGGKDAGAVYVVWGGRSGTVDLALVAQGIGGAKIVGAAGSLTGSHVAIGGDANGDGVADLIIGAPGTGQKAHVLFTPTSWQADDRIYGTAGNDVMTSGYGNYRVIGEGADVILGLNGNDSIDGAGGADSIEGGVGVDTLRGGAGNDTLDSGTGADVMAGGADDDSYIVDNALDVVTETLGEGTDTVYASVNHTLADNVEALVLTVAGRTGTGNAADNVLTGTAGADTLNGGLGADTLNGGLGDDSYFIDSALDVITETPTGGVDTVNTTFDTTLGANLENLVLTGAARVGTGNDAANRLTGTGFADTLDGGLGADTLTGGAGDDRYFVDNAGDSVVETLAGGNDTVVASVNHSLAANVETLILTGAARVGTGNTGANLITGTDFNDTLNGGAGVDTLQGGAGDDTYMVDTAGDVITDSSGIDTVLATASYTLGADVENLTLSVAGLTGTGNAGANAITGSSGSDTLDGGAGIDTLTGGAGNDTYITDGDVIVETLTGGIDTVISSLNLTLGAFLENLTLTGAARIGTGNGDANTLTGTLGKDTLDGKAGIDRMIGLGGDDTYYVDASGDVVVEVAGGGTDTVRASASYTLAAEIEALILTGAATDGTGNDLANTLTGNALANRLDGGAGADTMKGGAGDDTYVVDNAGDVVIEGAGGGNDTVEITFDYTLTAGEIENLTLTGEAHVGTGNATANRITGGIGNDTLDGAGGIDTLAGGSGDDTYLTDGTDVIVEVAGGGTDTMVASVSVTLAAEIERLVLSGASTGTGTEGANTLTGTSGGQVLIGLGGNDTLDGGAGADTMEGGQGDDTYTVDDLGDVVIETGTGGTDTVVTALDGYVMAAGIENIRLTGSARQASGNAGNNTVSGAEGNDDLDGGGGDDLLLGGDGNDNLRAHSGHDTLSGGTGDDTYHVSGAAVEIEDYLGHDTLDVEDSAGHNHIDLSGETETVIDDQICHITPGGTTSAPLDVQFLQDRSGSFADDIANVRTLVPQIVAALQAVQANSQFGVSSFIDKPVSPFGAAGEWVYAQHLSQTTDTALLSATYNGMTTLSGADGPEAQIEGLMQLALHIAEAGFRPDAARFVVLFTDAPYHVAGDGAAGGITTANNGDNLFPGNGAMEDYPTIAQLQAALVQANIIPIFAIAGGHETTYQDLANQLGRGAVVSLTANSSNIVAAITAGITTATTTHIEDARGGSGDDTMLGGVEDNGLWGNAGADHLDGRAGNDTLTGGSGDDDLTGGDGSDTATFSGARSDYAVTVTATGFVLHDLRVGGDGNDTVSGVEAFQFAGGLVLAADLVPPALAQVIDTDATVDAVAENAAAGTVVGLEVQGQNVGGGPVASAFALVTDATGTAPDLSGPFQIDAATGVITVRDGTLLNYEAATSHTLYVQATADGVSVVQAFTVAVTDVFEPVVVTLRLSAAADTYTALTNDHYAITGLAGNDVLTTLGGNDTLTGGTGNDTIVTGGGDDVIRVSGIRDGFDAVDGGTGLDRIEAGAAGTVIGLASVSGVEVISAAGFANVVIRGAGAANTFDFSVVTLSGISTIDGGAGNDTITGSAAADRILGGAGRDVLAGGDGADTFVFNLTTDSRFGSADRITDFAKGADQIDLTGIDADTGLIGDQAFAFLGSAGFGGHAGELRAVGLSTGFANLLGDTNGDGIADFQLLVALAAPQFLESTDFLL